MYTLHGVQNKNQEFKEEMLKNHQVCKGRKKQKHRQQWRRKTRRRGRGTSSISGGSKASSAQPASVPQAGRATMMPPPCWPLENDFKQTFKCKIFTKKLHETQKTERGSPSNLQFYQFKTTFHWWSAHNQAKTALYANFIVVGNKADVIRKIFDLPAWSWEYLS